jgi:hypothetical protein
MLWKAGDSNEAAVLSRGVFIVWFGRLMTKRFSRFLQFYRDIYSTSLTLLYIRHKQTTSPVSTIVHCHALPDAIHKIPGAGRGKARHSSSVKPR